MKIRLNWEFSLFLLLLLINLVPVLAFRFFPTIDGPAHLYNANLIRQLLTGDSMFLHQNFVLNKQPVPNWSAHFLLAFFGSFLPAFVADKVVMLFYMIGLPLVFRSLIRAVSPRDSLWSFMIFPFCYSFMFFFGFYNFLLGLVLMLGFISFHTRKDLRLSPSEAILAFGWLLAIYFSHLFLFGFTLIVCGIWSITNLPLSATANYKSWIKASAQKISLLALLALPGLVMAVYFFLSRNTYDKNYLPTWELLQWLKDLRPLIALGYEAEAPYVSKIAYILFLSVGLVIYIAVKDFITKREKKTFFSWRTDVWLVISLTILGLYFLLPDSIGYSGYVSVRFALLFFLFLIVWVAARRLPKWFSVPAMGLTMILHLLLNNYYYSVAREWSAVAKEIAEVADFIGEGEVVLPLDYSGNWLQGHYSNYLGMEKPVVILENYEATLDYFPIKWNDEAIPDYRLGELGGGETCRYWRHNPANQRYNIDQVFVLGEANTDENECTERLFSEINDAYQLIYEGTYCRLYRLAQQ